MKNWKRNLILPVGLAALVYLVLIVYADHRELGRALAAFHWPLLAGALGLALWNYFVRFLKWHYYVRTLQIDIPPGPSAVIFLSGLSMTVTPAKFGEVLKSYLLKQYKGTLMRRSAPIVLAERVTDLLGLLLISTVGIYGYRQQRTVLLFTAALLFALVLLLFIRPVNEFLLDQLGKFKRTASIAEKLRESYENVRVLLKPKVLLISTLFSVISWSAEGLSFYLILGGFGFSLPLLKALFIYAFATIAGAVSMLPGGLGVTEASLTHLIVREGAPASVAGGATILVRLATLWFAMGIGVLALFVYRFKFSKGPIEWSALDAPVNDQPSS